MKILVTGGAGYIGSHFLESFIASEFGHDSKIWIVDDLSGGHSQFIDLLRILAKEKGVAEFHFDQKSLLDETFIKKHLRIVEPDMVLHFAGKISVAESVKDPDLYFNNNVKGTKNLLQAMQESTCRKIIFSSTAAVYQPSFDQQPLREDFAIGPSSPYGENKRQAETMIEAGAKNWGLSAVIFRYFNAAGASASGRFGEWHEPETHLIPLMIAQAASTEGKKFKVYGSDYATRDGTCVRDYVHVTDLADAHIAGIQLLKAQGARSGCEYFNLGTNRGVTVLEMIEAASKALGKKIEFELVERRDGDSAVLVSAADRAKEFLNWEPKHSELSNILITADRWYQTLKTISSGRSL